MQNLKRKLVKRVEALGKALLSAFGRRGASQMRITADDLRRKRCSYPVQWHRWYKMNARRRRQLAAIKRLCGTKLNPRTVDLPRWAVR